MTTFHESFPKRPQDNSNFASTYSHFAKQMIIKEAQPLIKGHKKAKELWSALQIADYKKEGILNEAALQVLFQKQSQNIKELLQVKSAEELLLLLDEKGLGYLSQDEQILMFSIIKERMQVCASELCKIYEYSLQNEMLKSIRELEADIVHYQEILRKRIHSNEVNTYKTLGNEKLEEFETSWHEKFEKLNDKSQEKIQKIRENQEKELSELGFQLSKDILALKVKPHNLMRDLQIQEKLFAYNERFPEASQIRNELNVFETRELERVKEKVSKIIEKKKKVLMKKHDVELSQQILKNEEEENRMKIKYDQDKLRLFKEINHHYNEIKKNQNLSSSLAAKKGKFRDELRRQKQNASNLQKFIKDTKNSWTPKVASQKIFESQRSLKKNPSVLRMSLSLSHSPVSAYKGFFIDTNVLTRFSISTGTAISDRPVNEVPGYLSFGSLAAKTGKLLEKSKPKKDLLVSVTQLYDDRLKLIKSRINS